MEALFGTNGNLQHIKPFGMVAYMHTLAEMRNDKKFDDCAVQGFYVGELHYQKAHRVYVPSQCRMVSSKDVTFVENDITPQTKTPQLAKAIHKATHSIPHVEPIIAAVPGPAPVLAIVVAPPPAAEQPVQEPAQ
jgi:hypothetical protein